MSKEFTYRKLNWLDDVSCTLRGLPLSVAVQFAVHYIDSTTHQSRGDMTIANLAERLGATPANVIKAIARLVEGGWLECRKARGRGRSNTYRIADAWVESQAKNVLPAIPTNEEENVSPAIIKTYRRRYYRSRKDDMRTSPSESYAGSERAGARKKDGSLDHRTDASRPRREEAARALEELELDSNKLEIAASVALWDEQRARIEFEKFKEHFLNKLDEWERDGKRPKHDWNHYWRNTWCENGRKFDERDAKKATTHGSRHGGRTPEAAYEGCMNLYERQKRMYEEENANE